MMHWDWRDHCLSILIALQLCIAHIHIPLLSKSVKLLEEFPFLLHFLLHMNLTCFFQLAEGWLALGLLADLGIGSTRNRLRVLWIFWRFAISLLIWLIWIDSPFASSNYRRPRTGIGSGSIWTWPNNMGSQKKCKRLWAKLRNGGHPSWSGFDGRLQDWAPKPQSQAKQLRHEKQTIVTQSPGGKWTVEHHHITSCSSSLGSSKQPKYKYGDVQAVAIICPDMKFVSSPPTSGFHCHDFHPKVQYICNIMSCPHSFWW